MDIYICKDSWMYVTDLWMDTKNGQGQRDICILQSFYFNPKLKNIPSSLNKDTESLFDQSLPWYATLIFLK